MAQQNPILHIGLVSLLLVGALTGWVGPVGTSVGTADAETTVPAADDESVVGQQEPETSDTATLAVQESAQENETESESEEEREEEATTSRVRAVHMSPFLPALTVDVGFETVAQNLTFGEVSEYEQVESGEEDFEITRTENGDELFETETTIDPGVRYTVLAVATVTENETVRFQPALLRDEYELPEEDNATVRFVHASPDTPAVDVTLAESGDTIANNVSFREDGAYITGPADDVTLELRRATADGSGEVLHRASLSLEGGTVYSVFATGYLDPEAAPVDAPLDIGLFQDDQRESADDE